jgi:hypothetical protein
MEDTTMSLAFLLHVSAKHGPSSEEKKEHVIYKELFAYVQQSKLLTLQFKTRHTVCGHVTFKQVYTDNRSCKERTRKSNPDHATKGK